MNRNENPIPAFKRVEVLTRHLNLSEQQNNTLQISCCLSSKQGFTYEELPNDQRVFPRFKVEELSKPKIYKLSDKKTEVLVEYRRCDEIADKQELDFLEENCTKGNKTESQTSYGYVIPFNLIKPEGLSHVAVDKNTKQVIGLVRTHHRWVWAFTPTGDRKAIPFAYTSSLRLLPRYRGTGIADTLQRIALITEYNHGVRYFLAYIVQENTSSLNLAKRFVQDRTSTQKEFEISYAFGFPIDKPLKIPLQYPQGSLGVEFEMVKLDEVIDQVAWADKIAQLIKQQLVPTDLDNIFSSPFCLGTYLACLKSPEKFRQKQEGLIEFQHKLVVASFSVFSGFPNSQNQTTCLRPVLILNAYSTSALKRLGFSVDSESVLIGDAGLEFLIQELSKEYKNNKSHDFIFFMISGDQSSHLQAEIFNKWDVYSGRWTTKFWTWDDSVQVDTRSIQTFYDPQWGI